MRYLATRTSPAAALRGFDAQTDEDTIARFIDSAATTADGAGLLAALLLESLPLYTNRSTNETARIRGYTLAAFERAGLPPTAVAIVLEELDNGREPYVVAGAARAVRGFSRPPADLAPYLFSAIDNIKLRDDAITFDTYRPHWPTSSRTCAVAEILRTFEWLGAAAARAVPQLEALARDSSQPFTSQTRSDIARIAGRIRCSAQGATVECCDLLANFRQPIRVEPGRRRVGGRRLPNVVFENQDGRRAGYHEWCIGKPTIVVFFYTRCDNPNKCSLTVSQLARVQSTLRERGLERGIRTLAITYDSVHDRPPLLKAYGAIRGVTFSDDHHVVRIVEGADAIYAHFELGVNFGPATVNRHRIELFVLDGNGAIAATFQRLRWDVNSVVDEAAALRHVNQSDRRDRLFAERRYAAHWLAGMGGAAAGALALLVPKCPLCWASYVSVFGVTSMVYVPDAPSLRFALLSFAGFSAMTVMAKAKAFSGNTAGMRLLLLCNAGVALAAALDSSIGVLGGSLGVLGGTLLTRRLYGIPSRDV